MPDVSASPRRRKLLLGGAATLASGAAAGAFADRLLRDTPEAQPLGSLTEPFHGRHQAGIATRPQAHAAFIGLALRSGVGGDRVAALLRLLSDDAARLTAGQPPLADTEPQLAARPSRLTVTFGFGPGLFDAAGIGDRPPGFGELPEFGVDRLEDRWSGGDLLLQVCAEDPLTVTHAVRMLVKDARGFATVKWVQKGFLNAAGVRPKDATPRNVLGQLDGTANPTPGGESFADTVWLGRAASRWRGGTTLVLRRIRAELETWDTVDPHAKELSVGRKLDSGAPLTGERETDRPDFTATDDLRLPVIPANAHIRRARDPSGARIFRRSYNYDEAPDTEGRADCGLLFASYQADVAQFTAIQRRLDTADMLNRWVTPIGSAVFAIPPGCAAGDWIGSGLFA